MNPLWFLLDAIKKGARADMEKRQSVAMAFKTHIYLDMRDEGFEFSVHENMLIKPGHVPEPPPAGESAPGGSLTLDDYETAVSIRVWRNDQINLVLTLDVDRTVDFVGECIRVLRTITDRGLETERADSDSA